MSSLVNRIVTSIRIIFFRLRRY